ncbi:TetR/AcrR family transcriptional regulator [Vibrio natriegens]|uniref:Transcriptional regulator n=1 Tax=Vibrio natriegens NBRC 15636 = ATCC 14048 = DSM 759 TaxID=1219067 RepID=A0AAN1CYD8_VIBNA|nr:TetR/AcrR family transcriptional regulator [Vibrio natriegens]ALR17578.1 transcriptional regulator [Vibrio natriegens NBRC 15636 = ATCC 14048 = DSM 759]ANQ15068.1 transcriptional regulator [Vibrio natriegens NBRC 15636 = ATCC 14048 = DSM 759]ANQ23411.1 transcriptional regulator [Vibrio natriegens]EPM40063.1 transcriptional regulator [Vibrio natriegens NBRC 15636 = ATCC 14048 = DSM 759]MDX6029596.1 TetR/AcrR family transcriptional regulator [Vibrio natriegens NBRC 15636 = ATCC 14048 = DSM 75
MKKGKVTKEFILQRAFEIASEEGLESLTIGELAKLCGMSKSGLFAHFNSKLNLQLSVLEHANQVFTSRVIEPVRELGDDHIERKIRGLLDSWMTWNHSFQGSCMFLDAWNDTAEDDCPLQVALRKSINTWLNYLEIQIAKGKDNREFSSDLDTKQATFDLYGQYLSAHVFYSIKGEAESQRLFWQGIDNLFARWKA